MGAVTSYNGKNQWKKSVSTTKVGGILKECIYAAAMHTVKTGKDQEALDANDDKCLLVATDKDSVSSSDTPK